MAAAWTASVKWFDIAAGDCVLQKSESCRLESIIVFISTLAASQAIMCAFEGIGHTAGRNAERLHYKRPENDIYVQTIPFQIPPAAVHRNGIEMVIMPTSA